MCGGVKYTDKQNKTWTVYFPSPKAALPVLKKDGEIEWITWGKRKEENAPAFPNGGWARLDSIKDGKWQRYQPRPVLLPIQSFMEKDAEKVSHWFEVNLGEVVQGLLTVNDGTARVYVVTTDTPAEFSYIHDRWPRIIQRTHQTESIVHD
ncbi:MAG TPA: hypothetical protein PK056_08170 [Methylotenera sp.]|nr:hypothetical protein [Methylotenera sp.]